MITCVVPCYNSENTIIECLRSLKQQTMPGFKVIVVNDGSTDNSAELINDFIRDDIRFKLYNKDNGGLSDARNFGIDKCDTNYICFLDSDDVYSIHLFEILVTHLELQQADILMFGLKRFTGNIIFNSRTCAEVTNLSWCEVDKIYTFISGYKFNYITQAKLFNCDFLRRNNIRFQDISFEDRLFFLDCIKRLPRIASLDYIGLGYRLSPASITSTFSVEKVNDRLFVFSQFLDYFMHSEYYKNNRALIDDALNLHFLNGVIKSSVGSIIKDKWWRIPKNLLKLRRFLAETSTYSYKLSRSDFKILTIYIFAKVFL